MKRVLLLLIVVITFLNIETKAFVAKKIDLNVKDNETSIVFLRLENNISLLINENKDSNLFVLDYKNTKGLNESLKIFNSYPDVYYLNDRIKQKIDNINVFQRTNALKLKVNNYTFCIYDNNHRNLDNCDFIYIMELNENFVVKEGVMGIFYDDDISKDKLKNVQESWVDNSMVSADSFTILKLNEESYNIVVVPSTNY